MVVAMVASCGAPVATRTVQTLEECAREGDRVTIEEQEGRIAVAVTIGRRPLGMMYDSVQLVVSASPVDAGGAFQESSAENVGKAVWKEETRDHEHVFLVEKDRIGCAFLRIRFVGDVPILVPKIRYFVVPLKATVPSTKAGTNA